MGKFIERSISVAALLIALSGGAFAQAELFAQGCYEGADMSSQIMRRHQDGAKTDELLTSARELAASGRYLIADERLAEAIASTLSQTPVMETEAQKQAQVEWIYEFHISNCLASQP